MQILQPSGWARARGYSHGVRADGIPVFLASQFGWDGQGRIVSDDFVEQTRQALLNIVSVLAEAGGRPEDIVRMTWYVADKPSYLARSREIGAVWRDVIGCYTSTMSAVEVSSLMVEGALLQIEATAVIPRENKTNGLRQGDYGHE